MRLLKLGRVVLSTPQQLLSPNVALAGGVIVGSKSWVGIGSQVRQLITIGDNCLIGAGSTVVKNIPNNVTVFGFPAVPR